MTIRKTVFGSGNERELYHALSSTWGDDFALYPNVPFGQVVDVDSLTLKPSERETLLKSSFDYILCKPHSGQPILSVEFDGLGHGFSRDGRYVQRRPFEGDPYRKLKMDLKLRVCREEGYPLFVVSYEEKASISEATALTFVDGIIGQVLARRAHRKTLEEDFEAYREHVESLPEPAQREAIEDYLDGHQVNAEFRWNPIVRRAGELETQLGGWGSYSPRWLYDPDVRSTGGGPADFRDRVKQVDRVGCRLTVRGTKHEVTHEVWMRNMSDLELICESVCESIAEVLAYEELLQLQGARPKPT